MTFTEQLKKEYAEWLEDAMAPHRPDASLTLSAYLNKHSITWPALTLVVGACAAIIPSNAPTESDFKGAGDIDRRATNMPAGMLTMEAMVKAMSKTFVEILNWKSWVPHILGYIPESKRRDLKDLVGKQGLTPHS